MYSLVVTDVDTLEVTTKSFESLELAILYKDYHLHFGVWSKFTKWIPEKNVAPEDKKYVLDKKQMGGVSFCWVCSGLKFQILKNGDAGVNEVWDRIRKQRDALLVESDWTQLSDSPLSTEGKKDWRGYRDYLRAFPILHNDGSIVNAKIVSFKEWKAGKR